MVLENQSIPSVGDLLVEVEQRFAGAELFFGHGTDNARDEAAALVFHVLGLEHGGAPGNYAEPVSEGQRLEVLGLAARRVQERKPLPYLLGEAWFAGLNFMIDERVLIPRSPIAELIATRFEPWLDAGRIRSILEVGTGSACLAIACASAFPGAKVVATDISADALAVARINVAKHDVAGRVQLVEADHLDGIRGTYDLIIANPPYVPRDEMAALAAEYRHEPALGLVSGADGLDSARRILQDAPGLLNADGLLVLEVGAQWQAIEEAFPDLAFTWPEFEHGGIGVAVVQAADLFSRA